MKQENHFLACAIRLERTSGKGGSVEFETNMNGASRAMCSSASRDKSEHRMPKLARTNVQSTAHRSCRSISQCCHGSFQRLLVLTNSIAVTQSSPGQGFQLCSAGKNARQTRRSPVSACAQERTSALQEGTRAYPVSH